MTTVCLVSANLNAFDPMLAPCDQDIPQDNVAFEYYWYTDTNFPPRVSSMTPRLQARIPKCFAWDMDPTRGYDFYIWVDSSYAMMHRGSVQWFLDRCKGTIDMALFLHPHRHNIREEAEFLKDRIDQGDRYLESRYKGERVGGQLAAIPPAYHDDTLYASTAFIYRNTPKVQAMLTEWWVHISRFHSVDQLALPYLVHKHGLQVLRLSENIYKFPYLTRTRPSERKRKEFEHG